MHRALDSRVLSFHLLLLLLLLLKQHFICVEVSSENSHDVSEHEHDSLKVSMWCVLMKNRVFSPFFFEVSVVTDDTYLAMLDNTALHHVTMGTVFQLGGAPPYFSC